VAVSTCEAAAQLPGLAKALPPGPFGQRSIRHLDAADDHLDGQAEITLPTATPVVTVCSGPAANEALATLNTLAVKGRVPKIGYDRAQFGQAWTDDVNVGGGRNGCGTRSDTLRRDLSMLKPGSNGCAVEFSAYVQFTLTAQRLSPERPLPHAQNVATR
jgi:hypothetical protein